MIGQSTETLIGVLLLAGANLGVIGFMLKKYTESVDKHNEKLPEIASTLNHASETLKEVLMNLRELFASRNDHETRLVSIEKVHELHGCNDPVGPEWLNPYLRERRAQPRPKKHEQESREQE